MIRRVVPAAVLLGLMGCGSDGPGPKDTAVAKDVGGSVDRAKSDATADAATLPDKTVGGDRKLGDTSSACGSCHTLPPSTGKHSLHVTSKGIKCSACHQDVVDDTNKIINTSLHNNGEKNVKGSFTWSSSTKQCSSGCHGTKTW